MAANVFLDEIELSVVPMQAAAAGRFGDPGYPLPRLDIHGDPKLQRFQTIVLENAYLRVTLTPELGGRIISFYDKRFHVECLPFGTRLEPGEGGPRGQWIPAGIQWEIGEPIRRTSMAEVDVQVVETEDETARAVLFELIPGLDIGWHLWLDLPPDRAALSVEWRALNRSAEEHAYTSGLFVGGPNIALQRHSQGVCGWMAEAGAGFAIHFDEGDIDEAVCGRDGFRILRTFPSGGLAPRQSDHLRLTLTPMTGQAPWLACSQDAGLAFEEGSIVVIGTRAIEGKAFLLTESGDTLEAPLGLGPTSPARFDWPSDQPLPKRIVLREKNGGEILRWPQSEFVSRISGPAVYNEDKETPPLARDPRQRPAAHLALAKSAVLADDLGRARECVEDALLFNGDDPLAWWLLAALRRNAGDEDEGPELPNAHYLAPMEPMLRVEAFLSQPITMVAEPNTLIAPLAENPDLLVEGAVRLLEAGLRKDAARFLDEALRHHDLPMLRYLAAHNLLSQAGMEAEAALHVAQAGKRLFGPSYPWRGPEIEALRTLHERFPADERLRAAVAP